MLTAEQLAALERAEQLAGLAPADRVVSAHDPRVIRYPSHGLDALVRESFVEIMEPIDSPLGRCAVSVAVRGSAARVLAPGRSIRFPSEPGDWIPAPDGYEKVNQWFIDQQAARGIK